MLGIGSRALAALRSNAKHLSAIEIMRSLPRHREASSIPAAVAQKKFLEFEQKYKTEPLPARGAIFREFAYAVASGAFIGAMEPLARHFATTFAKDGAIPVPEPNHQTSAAPKNLLPDFEARSTRSGMRTWGQKVAQMKPEERLEVWRAAASVRRDLSSVKSLGTALLESEAKQALKDCVAALTDAAVQTPKLAAPDLLVIAAIRDLTKDSKVRGEITRVLQSFGGAAGRSRANSASVSPTPAEAQAALSLPKTAKQPHASITTKGPSGPEKASVSKIDFPDAPHLSGLMSKTFSRGNFSKVRVLRTHEGIFYAVRMMRTSDKPLPAQTSGTAPPPGQRPTERTVPNDIWNEERIMDLVDSPVRSLARSIDDKGRTFSVVRLFDGNVESLISQLEGPAKAALLGLAATRLLESLVKLEARGLVHGDIKPDNLLFDLEGDVVLGDYGKAHSAEVRGSDGDRPYFPPERVSPNFELAPKYDLYSTGLSLVHMTIGGAFDHFPLRAGAGYTRTKELYETWQAVRAGSSSELVKGPVRARLQLIDEAHAAMTALDPHLAKIVFQQLLQPDPGRRGDSATALKQLSEDGLDRLEIAQSHLSAFEEVASTSPILKKLRDLKVSLEQAAALQ